MVNEAMGIVEIAWEEISKERALRNPKVKPEVTRKLGEKQWRWGATEFKQFFNRRE